MLAYVGGKVWQQNVANTWYSKTAAGAWSTGTAVNPLLLYLFFFFVNFCIHLPSSLFYLISSLSVSEVEGEGAFFWLDEVLYSVQNTLELIHCYWGPLSTIHFPLFQLLFPSLFSSFILGL